MGVVYNQEQGYSVRDTMATPFATMRPVQTNYRMLTVIVASTIRYDKIRHDLPVMGHCPIGPWALIPTNTALKHYQETTKDLVAVSSISAQIRDAEARLESVNKTLAAVESRLARINSMV